MNANELKVAAILVCFLVVVVVGYEVHKGLKTVVEQGNTSYDQAYLTANQ